MVSSRRDRRDQIAQQKGLIQMTDRMFRTELMSAEVPARRRTPWLVGISVAILILIVLGFVAVRLSVDVPSIAAGTAPDDAYDARFVRHPWLTYLHIGPGVLYMVGATLQLAYWFRRRHYPVHRRLDRILLGAGLLTGATAVAVGLLFPIGGPAEMSATVLFGVWFLVCLVLAFRAIRADDIVRHRRRMIRAFAIGVAVGTIRIWIALFVITGLLDLPAAFGPAFWIAFTMHAFAAELWLRFRPLPPEMITEVQSAPAPRPPVACESTLP
jgi:uncharacterized membrane protein